MPNLLQRDVHSIDASRSLFRYGRTVGRTNRSGVFLSHRELSEWSADNGSEWNMRKHVQPVIEVDLRTVALEVESKSKVRAAIQEEKTFRLFSDDQGGRDDDRK